MTSHHLRPLMITPPGRHLNPTTMANVLPSNATAFQFAAAVAAQYQIPQAHPGIRSGAPGSHPGSFSMFPSLAGNPFDPVSALNSHWAQFGRAVAPNGAQNAFPHHHGARPYGLANILPGPFAAGVAQQPINLNNGGSGDGIPPAWAAAQLSQLASFLSSNSAVSAAAVNTFRTAATVGSNSAPNSTSSTSSANHLAENLEINNRSAESRNTPTDPSEPLSLINRSGTPSAFRRTSSNLNNNKSGGPNDSHR